MNCVHYVILLTRKCHPVLRKKKKLPLQHLYIYYISLSVIVYNFIVVDLSSSIFFSEQLGEVASCICHNLTNPHTARPGAADNIDQGILVNVKLTGACVSLSSYQLIFFQSQTVKRLFGSYSWMMFISAHKIDIQTFFKGKDKCRCEPKSLAAVMTCILLHSGTTM